MYGTLAGALAARRVEFDRDRFTAAVAGTIEGEGKTIHITKVHVYYTLAIARGQRNDAERALRVHPAGCPAHESVKDLLITHILMARQVAGRGSGW
jgi:hypothetical protein